MSVIKREAHPGLFDEQKCDGHKPDMFIQAAEDKPTQESFL